jgi:hypothetical protein
LYASTLERYNNKKAKKIFDTMLKKNPSLTIAEIAQQTGIDPDIYDWELLNLIMLSQIAHNQHNKVTIVYAGGDHTDCIKPLLPELGYELITDLGSDEVMDTNYEDQRGTIPVLNLEQIPTILAEKGLFNAHAIANDYLIPLYRTVTTGQFPLGSFV